MSDAFHIHDDDLELYHAGHLESEFVATLELHLAGCPDCQERLHQCIGPRSSDIPLAKTATRFCRKTTRRVNKALLPLCWPPCLWLAGLDLL